MIMRYRILFAILATTVVAAAPACAVQGGFPRYPSERPRAIDDRAYRNGYNAGINQGQNDARRGRGLDYDRHREFRSADRGYDGYGSRNEYRRVFRQGFVAGYDAGYRRDARNERRDDRRYPPARPPVYGGGQDRGTVYRSSALDNGSRDGYDAGRRDASRGDRFDPVRDKRYREGDHDYNSRDGSRAEYTREYRDAFQRGYERGYREGRQ